MRAGGAKLKWTRGFCPWETPGSWHWEALGPDRKAPQRSDQMHRLRSHTCCAVFGGRVLCSGPVWGPLCSCWSGLSGTAVCPLSDSRSVWRPSCTFNFFSLSSRSSKLEESLRGGNKKATGNWVLGESHQQNSTAWQLSALSLSTKHKRRGRGHMHTYR